MKKHIPLALLVIFSLWLATRPAVREHAKNFASIVRELFSEAHETLVDAPIDQARNQYMQDAQKKALEEAEARQKQIDAEVDRQTLISQDQ